MAAPKPAGPPGGGFFQAADLILGFGRDVVHIQHSASVKPHAVGLRQQDKTAAFQDI